MSKRGAGVLCHITSLPGNSDYGDLGNNAYRFINFLSSTGFSVWQILPTGPTHSDLCPYQPLSVHAGNPQLINLEWLCEKGWLRTDELHKNHGTTSEHHSQCIQQAYRRFKSIFDYEESLKYESFLLKHKYWLEEYTLYIAIREKFDNQPWVVWPEPFRNCNSSALQKFSNVNQSFIDTIKFQQYIFFTQWAELKKYANDNGVLIIGDIPFFVAHDSADVWANRKYFALDQIGYPKFVAGVPPDYYSKMGQRWGNPHYQWQNLEVDGFSWWINRIRTQYELYDAIRIDHFRGLVKYWEIPANETTAISGRWVAAPGRHLLQVITRMFPNLCLIAEDLGTITPDVYELRDEFALPGMNVLQFAFDGKKENPYLPQNHTKHSIVYTATHDNDTTIGWFESLSTETQQYVRKCINYEIENMPWPVIFAALDSVSNLVMLPMQDILNLGKGNRMNTPGTIEGNWKWRFDWSQIDAHLATKFAELLEKYKRINVIENKTYSSTQIMQPVSN